MLRINTIQLTRAALLHRSISPQQIHQCVQPLHSQQHRYICIHPPTRHTHSNTLTVSQSALIWTNPQLRSFSSSSSPSPPPPPSPSPSPSPSSSSSSSDDSPVAFTDPSGAPSTIPPPVVDSHFFGNYTSHPVLTILSIPPDADQSYLESWRLLGDWLFGGETESSLEFGEKEITVEIEKGKIEKRKVKTIIWSGELRPVADFLYTQPLRQVVSDTNSTDSSKAPNIPRNPNAFEDPFSAAKERRLPAGSFIERFFKFFLPEKDINEALATKEKPSFWARFRHQLKATPASITGTPPGMHDGFCSIVSPRFDPPLNLMVYDFVSVTCETDHRPYLMHIRTSQKKRNDVSFVARINDEVKVDENGQNIELLNKQQNLDSSSLNPNFQNIPMFNSQSSSADGTTVFFPAIVDESDKVSQVNPVLSTSASVISMRRKEATFSSFTQMSQNGVELHAPPLPKYDIRSFGFSIRGYGKFRFEFALLQAHQGTPAWMERQEKTEMIELNRKKYEEKQELEQIKRDVAGMTFDEEVEYWKTKLQNMIPQGYQKLFGISEWRLKVEVWWSRTRRKGGERWANDLEDRNPNEKNPKE